MGDRVIRLRLKDTVLLFGTDEAAGTEGQKEGSEMRDTRVGCTEFLCQKDLQEDRLEIRSQG